MTRGYARLTRNFKTGFWAAMIGRGTIPIHAEAQKGRKPNPRRATQLESIDWCALTHDYGGIILATCPQGSDSVTSAEYDA